jgi:hypothetical protein
MIVKTRPKTFTISERRASFEGDRYLSQFIGAQAVHTTWEGVHMVGIVEGFHQSMYPIIRFEDGRWASGELDSIVQTR